MNKILSTLVAMVFATALLAQSGLSCEDAIPVDKNYAATIDGPCEVWYSAWTYDLPLNVHFIPDDINSSWGPEVQVDLTCTPGVYADRKLDSLINMVEEYDVTFPIEMLCDYTNEGGKPEWDLSVNKSYREQLAEFGIPYNIQAFIKVTYFESGRVSLKPDTAFSNCMETAEYIQLSDTLDILADDKERVFVLSYADWQEDSIRFVWTGDQPITVYAAVQKCDFEPTSTNPFVWNTFSVSADAPYKLYSDQMKSAIKNHGSGGLFYGKMLSSTSGKLVVEKIPRAMAQGGAIELEYGKSVQIGANDNTLYCFPKTWTATEFVASGRSNITAYFAKDDEFAMSSTDANVIDTYSFSSGVNPSISLSTKEMGLITAKAVDDYIYVRFNSSVSTTITPEMWVASTCVDESILIEDGQLFRVAANTYMTVYRLYYNDWKGGDLEIKWSGSNRLPVYISDTCHYFLSSTDAVVVQYDYIKAKGTQLHDAATVDSWANRVDADGYLYVRFDASRAGNVTFTSIKPEPVIPDPIYTTIAESICFGESYTWNGKTYSASGDYQQTLVAANGADSIVTLKLTILPEVPATTEKAEIIAGETYTWNGKEYTEAGEYTITLQDENGCDYQATLILNVLPPLSPCLQASVKLNVGDELKVNLASAFTVYAIDYNAWMQQAVSLVWTGIEPLHTFVAETCEFALAPYNRYVHAYVPIPAQGDWVLDMNALAPYVDEDGYLYVRFLTEFEGTLRVK